MAFPRRGADDAVAQACSSGSAVDVSSFGSTEDEAPANLREAPELYFEDAPADAIAKMPAVRRLTLRRS